VYALGLTEREKTTLVTLLINEIFIKGSSNDCGNPSEISDMEKLIEKIEKSF
jgi:hypothetical protein